jgi:hypothetical protein
LRGRVSARPHLALSGVREPFSRSLSDRFPETGFNRFRALSAKPGTGFAVREREDKEIELL